MPLSLTPDERASAGDAPDAEPISLLRLANVVLRHRRMVVIIALVAAAVMVGRALLSARTYTSSALFTPSSHRAPGGAAGLAAQFGIAISGADASESPQFYSDLLQSRAILDTVVRTPVAVGPRADEHTTLVALWGKGATPRIREYVAEQELKKHLSSTVDVKVGTVALKVTAESPVLAYQLATRLIDAVNRFNLNTRRSQATAEREFARQRLDTATADLRAAENRLAEFDQENRAILGSPRLNLDRDRLQREISMRQQLFTSLSQAYEQAKLDEVRDTPVITVIETPDIPALPDPRGAVKKLIIGVFVGALLGIALAFTGEYFGTRSEAEPNEASEFEALKREARSDLRHPWRLLTRSR